MLGERFATQPNALNLLRLLLASAVIVWHATSLGPSDTVLPAPAAQLLENVPVDAFFAISGFLIARSWQHSPHLVRFLTARAVRVLPGLWVCLLVTAFVLAPAAALLSGTAAPTLSGQLGFVAQNLGTYIGTVSIDGIGSGLIYADSWNGSQWTLWWEVSCYVVLAAAGLLGALRLPVVAAAVALFWGLQLAAVNAGVPDFRLSRLGLMFACGALLWLLRDRIPMHHGLAGGSVALVAAGSLLPTYRLVAGLALAYLCLWVALRLGRHERLVLRHDISYGVYIYGWPVQQFLVMAGLAGSWAAFSLASLAATVPLAAASWLLVERPAMRLRSRLTRRRVVAAAVEPFPCAVSVGHVTISA